MADTEAIKREIVEEAVEAAKATVLATSQEGRKQNTHPKQISASEATSHKMGPSLRQPVFHWTT